jgi:S1-C subfamily serine protease
VCQPRALALLFQWGTRNRNATTDRQLSRLHQVDVPEGNGTGIVWDNTGNIVTNYHVLGSVLAAAGVSGAAAPPGAPAPSASAPPPRRVASVARVTLLGTDGKNHEYVAELVGADRAKDLAVIRISAPAALLRPVALGTSDSVRVGQTVLAIGNPFGFDVRFV